MSVFSLKHKYKYEYKYKYKYKYEYEYKYKFEYKYKNKYFLSQALIQKKDCFFKTSVSLFPHIQHVSENIVRCKM